MIELKFTGDNIPRHNCVGIQDGDNIIWKCDECDYQRIHNLKTGKSKISGGNFYTLHQGSMAGEEIKPNFSLN